MLIVFGNFCGYMVYKIAGCMYNKYGYIHKGCGTNC